MTQVTMIFLFKHYSESTDDDEYRADVSDEVQ